MPPNAHVPAQLLEKDPLLASKKNSSTASLDGDMLHLQVVKESWLQIQELVQVEQTLIQFKSGTDVLTPRCLAT